MSFIGVINYYLKFKNNNWDLHKLFDTALILASQKSNIEAVKMLLEQKGIDLNTKNVYFVC